MKEEMLIRRKETARQIVSAMAEAGVSKTGLARMLGRKPSVVTQWLSGNHNFTLDTLAEISAVLHKPITGVSSDLDLPLVSGYASVKEVDAVLNEPSEAIRCISMVSLPPLEFSILDKKARDLGVSLRNYAEFILCKEANSSPKTEIDKTAAFIECCFGAWRGAEYDAIVDELSKSRTFREVVEL